MSDQPLHPRTGFLSPKGETARCRVCHRDLPLARFTADRSKKSGHATICRDCDHKRNRDHRERVANREARRVIRALCIRVEQLEAHVATLEAERADHIADRDPDHVAGIAQARRLARAVAIAARLELRAKRYQHVLELRAAGYGAKRIARELGVSRDSARDLIRRAEAASQRRGVAGASAREGVTPPAFREKHEAA